MFRVGYDILIFGLVLLLNCSIVVNFNSVKQLSEVYIIAKSGYGFVQWF